MHRRSFSLDAMHHRLDSFALEMIRNRIFMKTQEFLDVRCFRVQRKCVMHDLWAVMTADESPNCNQPGFIINFMLKEKKGKSGQGHCYGNHQAEIKEGIWNRFVTPSKGVHIER
jgi:hypothetical protein